MTTIENALALHMVRENFGGIAETIAGLLITKHSYPFQLIADDLKIERKKVSFVILNSVFFFIIYF